MDILATKLEHDFILKISKFLPETETEGAATDRTNLYGKYRTGPTE